MSRLSAEQLNNLDHSQLVDLVLSQKEEHQKLDDRLQKFVEEVADANRHRFGRSTEAFEPDGQILAMIQAIYNADNALKDLPPDERLIKRQTAVKPLVEAYFAWCHAHENQISSKSKTGNGISYSLNQERYLKVFLEDPDVPLDNNSAERSIRSFCIGKKNFVMIDTVSGEKASVIIYSLVETAKTSNLNVYEYIKYLLTEILEHMDDTNTEFSEKLLPWSDSLLAECKKKI